jgi:hypothetical protein
METAPPTNAPDQEGNLIARIVAFLGGALVMLVGAPFSLGASLLAPIAMVIGSAVWRQRGRTLSMVGHWLAAVCGAAVVFLLFAGALTTLMPKGSWSKLTLIADSAQKASANQPPPAWLERIAPGAAAKRAAAKPTSERAQKVSLAFGAAFALFFFVGFYGSLAWAAGMLLGYGVNGRWPGQTPIASRSPA